MKNTKIGLGLSGGGYRAAAYHIGTLEALNEIKVEEKKNESTSFLSRVTNYATVSGGSIMGAYYLKHRKDNGQTDFNKFRKAAEKNILNKNCEFFSIIMNKALFIYPFFIGLLGWIAALLISCWAPKLIPNYIMVQDKTYQICILIASIILLGISISFVKIKNIRFFFLFIFGLLVYLVLLVVPLSMYGSLPDSAPIDLQVYRRVVLTLSIFFILFSVSYWLIINYLHNKLKKNRNRSLFNRQGVAISCVSTIIVSLLAVAVIMNSVISLPFIFIGFSSGAFVIGLLLVLITEMHWNKTRTLILGTVAILLISIFCGLVVFEYIDIYKKIQESKEETHTSTRTEITADKGEETGLDKISQKKLISESFFFGIFLFAIYFIVYLLFPTGFSKRKGEFLEDLYKIDSKDKKTKGKNHQKNMVIDDLPKGIQIGIIATRIEKAQTCVFRRIQDESKNRNSYPLADAVSKSSNFPPVFEPEEIDRQECKNYRENGSIMLLDKLNDREESGEDSISLSDGGSLDNHGISVLANKKSGLFSNIILISDSDPPYEIKDVHQGFIAQILDLITNILLKNVQTLNYERYFDDYLEKYGGILKPVFISLKDDIRGSINKYRDRAIKYLLSDFLYKLKDFQDEEKTPDFIRYFIKDKLCDEEQFSLYSEEYRNNKNTTEKKHKTLLAVVTHLKENDQFIKYMILAAEYCIENIQTNGKLRKDFLAQSRFEEYGLVFFDVGDNNETKEKNYADLFKKIGFSYTVKQDKTHMPAKKKDKSKDCLEKDNYGYFVSDIPEHKEILDGIRNIGTRLIPIDKPLQYHLIHHAKTLTDFLVKFWLLKRKDNTNKYLFRKDVFVCQLDKEDYEKIKSDFSKYYTIRPDTRYEFNEKLTEKTPFEIEKIAQEIYEKLIEDNSK